MTDFPLTSDQLKVFETVPELYLILLPDLHIITASDAYLEATFTVRQQIAGKYFFDVFPDNPNTLQANSISNLNTSLQEVLATKKPHKMALQRYDVPLPNKRGEFEEKYWQPLNTPILDDQKNVLYIIHKVTDVTQTVRAYQGIEKFNRELEDQIIIRTEELEAARKEAESERKQFEQLLMQAPALIAIYEGPTHIFKFVNPPYQNLVGDRHLLGKPIAEAMPELKSQSIFALLDKVYHTGESFYAHEMLVQLDHDNSGELGENYYNFVYQATRNLKGEIEGVLVFAYEVTTLVLVRQHVEQSHKKVQSLYNELAATNEKLNTTNKELTGAKKALETLNAELEQRVITRTKELKLAQQEAESQQELLHELFMQAPAPIVILEGEQLVFQLVNPAYQQIFPGRELLNKPLLEALLN